MAAVSFSFSFLGLTFSQRINDLEMRTKKEDDAFRMHKDDFGRVLGEREQRIMEIEDVCCPLAAWTRRRSLL